jgi:hypothetical protein
MVVVLESALVLVFPAFALWAARTGGTGRLWRVTAVALALIGGLALMAASAGFGNRLAAQQGYGRTALGTLALARSSGGYRSSRAPSRCTPPGAGSAADGASTSSARLPPRGSPAGEDRRTVRPPRAPLSRAAMSMGFVTPTS